MNLKKPDLTTTQDLVYIGVRFRMDLGRVHLLEDRIEGLLAKVGQYVSALFFLSLLGLVAAMLQLVEYAHLHISSDI